MSATPPRMDTGGRQPRRRVKRATSVAQFTYDVGQDAIASLERIRRHLVAFGALDKDDRITDPAELIAILLPPATGA